MTDCNDALWFNVVVDCTVLDDVFWISLFDGRFGDVDLALLALFFVPVNGRNACSRRSSEIGWSKTSTEPPTNSSSTIDFFHDLRLGLGMGSFINRG